MSERGKLLAPRVLAAVGLLAVAASTACYPITFAKFPLPGSTTAPEPTEAPTTPATPRPTPSASPSASASP